MNSPRKSRSAGSRLGLSAILVGATATSAANPPAPTLPNPLVAANGTPITNVEQWETTRRPELLELFREHVYGRNPVERPADLRFEVLESGEVFAGRAIRQLVRISFSGPRGEMSFPLTVYLPTGTTPPRGCFVVIVNRNRAILNESHEQPRAFWPVDEIIARGYATAAFHNSDLAVDQPADGLQSGVFQVYDDLTVKPRPGDAWAVIAAWAWGASRALDYLLTVPALQDVPMAVIGHSRGGKTALWCGAQDTRFALAISNNSGTTGAAITRGNQAETVAQINTRFPHWFASNYHRFNDAEDTLPIDQHQLLALMAPRRVYVASASADIYADIAAEFRSCVEATPVFQLYDLPGVGAVESPVVGTVLHDGAIGYHQRAGKHDLTTEDWSLYLDYTDRHWVRE